MASAKATDPQSLNRYSYVSNNPMVFSDPSGMQRGPGSFFNNNPEISHAQGVGGSEVEAAESYYEDRLAGKYDSIMVTVEPIDGALEQGQQHHAQPQNPMKDGPIGTPCSDALTVANATIEGVNRALQNRQDLKDVAAKYGNIIDWKILAALGIRESNFQNVAELGGGPGRGVFQISTGAPASITGDVKASADYVMQNRLVPQYNKYLGTYGPELALIGALRDYNHSDATTPGILNNALRKGYYEELDSDTAPYRSSGRTVPGNYVSNVRNIAKCMW